MKNLLICFLTLGIPFLLSSQNTIVSDTIYFTLGSYTTAGTVLTPQKTVTKVRVKKYSNGDQQTYIENLGDSLQSQSRIVEDYLSNMNVFLQERFPTSQPSLNLSNRDVNYSLS